MEPNEVAESTLDPFDVPWAIGDVVKATLIMTLSLGWVIVLLAVGVATTRRELLSDPSSVWRLIVITVVAEAFLFVVTCFFSVAKYHISWGYLGFRPFASSRGVIMASVVVSLGLAINVAYVSAVRALGLDFLMPHPLPEALTQPGPVAIIFGLTAVVIAPLAEETFFRGFVLTAVGKRFGSARGVLLSSALFSLAHFQIAAVIPIFLLGLLLARLYLRSGSIWPCVVAHLAYNLLVLTVT